MIRNAVILFLMLIFLASSCEEDIVINSEFTQDYVLNCVIDADSSFQIATVQKTYRIEGFNPLENTEDKSVDDAAISFRD